MAGCNKSHKRKKNQKTMKRGGRMAPMNPSDFPVPLPQPNPSLDAAFALAQDPLNRALMSGGAYKQGYNSRLDHSLARRHGKKKTKYATRRKQSKGMERYLKRRAYASVKSMDKNKRTKGGKKYKKNKKTRGGQKSVMDMVRKLQNQSFIQGQTDPFLRTLSHSGGSPAPIPPNTVHPAHSNNLWVGENGQTFFGASPQAAFHASMANGNKPATKSMYQNRWTPFVQ